MLEWLSDSATWATLPLPERLETLRQHYGAGAVVPPVDRIEVRIATERTLREAIALLRTPAATLPA